jgi:ferredoxin-type protein NapG
MQRRDFLTFGFNKLAPKAAPITWIRPPFAVSEDQFLLSCSRCHDCVDACPHGVLILLPAVAGLKACDTPVMTLDRFGCHLCTDWPCVSACTTGSLQPADTPHPPLALAQLDAAACLPYAGPECGACAGSCPVPNGLIWDGPKPVITSSCIGCGLCREACIVSPKAIYISRLPEVARHAP